MYLKGHQEVAGSSVGRFKKGHGKVLVFVDSTSLSWPSRVRQARVCVGGSTKKFQQSRKAIRHNHNSQIVPTKRSIFKSLCFLAYFIFQGQLMHWQSPRKHEGFVLGKQ
jgi:hypothetical protein